MNDGNPFVEVVLDGLVAVFIFLSAATVIAMAAAFASLISHVAGIVHDPGATGSLFATSGILLLSTILSVLASIAAQRLSVGWCRLKSREGYPSRVGQRIGQRPTFVSKFELDRRRLDAAEGCALRRDHPAEITWKLEGEVSSQSARSRACPPPLRMSSTLWGNGIGSGR